jgi:hypothetical protein
MGRRPQLDLFPRWRIFFFYYAKSHHAKATATHVVYYCLLAAAANFFSSLSRLKFHNFLHLYIKVRLLYRAKSMLDELARRVFDKFTPSKAAISAFLLDEFARPANSSLKLGTLLDSVNAS